MPAARARCLVATTELRDRLAAVADEFVQAHYDPDGVRVRLLVGYYSRGG